ncbi:MAG: alpha-ketoacid dehydrogenase subunit beta [Planctomycetota bacterium]
MSNITMIEAVRSALHDGLQNDESVVVFGEEIAEYGGAFGVTEGLAREFGPDRVFDLPVSETGLIGAAVGMAMYGLRPVTEITFADDLAAGFEQITAELAKLRYRSAGRLTAPVVIRAPIGAGVCGGPDLSQSPEAWFAHTPGLQVVVPSTAADARGLLMSALQGQDPVLFLEPKALYHSAHDEVDAADAVPIGRARIAREGTGVTVITYGATVPLCLEAAEQAKGEDIDVEVVDLRTLVPLDTETLLESVAKTGRVVIVHEAPKTGGFGGEVAAVIAEKAIEYLESPIVRVAGFDTPVPLAFEDDYRPDVGRILSAVSRVASF